MHVQALVAIGASGYCSLSGRMRSQRNGANKHPGSPMGCMLVLIGQAESSATN